jgi:hypothetical protein
MLNYLRPFPLNFARLSGDKTCEWFIIMRCLVSASDAQWVWVGFGLVMQSSSSSRWIMYHTLNNFLNQLKLNVNVTFNLEFEVISCIIL